MEILLAILSKDMVWAVRSGEEVISGHLFKCVILNIIFCLIISTYDYNTVSILFV